MARIVFVHGMSREGSRNGTLTTKATLVSEFARCLRGQMKDHVPRFPVLSDADFDLAFWAALYQPPVPETAKGLVDDFQTVATGPLRALVRLLDRRSKFSAQGRPLNLPARMGFGYVYQTVFYMADEPSQLVRDRANRGVYDQVQDIFRACIHQDRNTPENNTRVVIGHSLGSVVAYEGLCAMQNHSVDTLVTIGSPLGARRLIYDKLRPEMAEGRRPWPGVRRWINIASIKDYVCVPEPRLAGLFLGPVEDHVMTFGSAVFPGAVHRVQRYLREDGRRDGIIPKVVAEALARP